MALTDEQVVQLCTLSRQRCTLFMIELYKFAVLVFAGCINFVFTAIAKIKRM